MAEPVVARFATPTLIAVQLGALITSVTWFVHGPRVGIPMLVLAVIASVRAARSGFVLDDEGLHDRPFLPFVTEVVIPWSDLRSVDVDDVVVGSEARTKQSRLRFLRDRAPTREWFGCRDRTIDDVLDLVRAHGLPATDRRRSNGAD